MHKLVRQVRFSINPFLEADSIGFNSYASRPTGEGLSIFFELCVGVVGRVEPDTGFVVNITDIDKCVRQYVVPIFARQIRQDYREGRHIGFFKIVRLLKSSQEQLADKFGKAKLGELSLKLNPFRKVAIDCEDYKMVYFSERFEFAAMHKLWNDGFSDERNFAVFGKCANPAGHGHNYVAEVTVKVPADGAGLCIGDFEKTVSDEFIELVDHKNLNADVTELGGVNPTVENLAVFAWNRLSGNFEQGILHCVSIWETDKTYCCYYGS